MRTYSWIFHSSLFSRSQYKLLSELASDSSRELDSRRRHLCRDGFFFPNSNLRFSRGWSEGGNRWTLYADGDSGSCDWGSLRVNRQVAGACRCHSQHTPQPKVAWRALACHSSYGISTMVAPRSQQIAHLVQKRPPKPTAKTQIDWCKFPCWIIVFRQEPWLKCWWNWKETYTSLSFLCQRCECLSIAYTLLHLHIYHSPFNQLPH